MGKLNKLREERGLSTTQLSYILGVNQSTIVRYEKSEELKTISIATLEKYAQALGYYLHYEFLPLSNVSKNKTPLPQKTTRFSQRGKSKVSNYLKQSELEIIKNLDPESKMKRAFELSSFLRKFKERA